MGQGAAVAGERRRRGLTQAELAERAGIGVRTLRDIESGRVAAPHPRTLRRLALALGLPLGLPLGPAPGPAAGTTGFDDAAAAGPGGLEIRVFGPLAVTFDGAALEIRSLMQRGLLGLLALHAGRTVVRDEIARVLWEGDPPQAYQGLLHTYVARLRRLPGLRDAVVSAGGGYALRCEAVDVLRFEALARTGLAGRAVDVLRSALDAARGPVLADLADCLRTHPAAVALAARRVEVALAYADVAPPGAAVDALQAIAVEESLHEGVHAKLMTALAAAGRRAQALALYTEIRTRLREELGVEPGELLARAHAGILRQRVAPRSPVPAQLPAAVTHFTGRSAQLAGLDACLAPGGDTALAVITGTAGVGKTGLAVEWGRRAAGRFPDGQLFVSLHGYSHVGPVAPAAALRAILQSLGVAADRIPDQEDAAAALYRSTLAARRLLIVLDNARSPDQVRPLLPGAPTCAVLVTSRDRLDGLAARDGAHRIDLDVLSPAEAVELLKRILGAHRADAVGELAEACARLPLALRIAAAHLQARPAVPVAQYAGLIRTGALADTLSLGGDRQSDIRSTFRLSYRALAEPDRELFRLLGLVPGADFAPDAAAALADITAGDADRRLDRLAAAHLVSRPRPGRFALHDLLHAYARSLIPEGPSADSALARLAAWYRRAVAQAARHAYPGAAPAPRQPPDHGRQYFADAHDAKAWLNTEHDNILALIDAAAATPATRPESWLIVFSLRSLFIERPSVRPWLAAATTALEAAGAQGDELGEAMSHRGIAIAHEQLGDLAAAGLHLRRSAELSRRLNWDEGETSALNNLGIISIQHGRLGEAAQAFRSNAAHYRRIGDTAGLARSLCNLGLVQAVRGDLREGLAVLRRAQALGTGLSRAAVLFGIGAALRDLGENDEAAQALAAAVAAGHEAGETYFTCAAEGTLAGLACDRGDLDAAAVHLARAWELARRVGLAKREALTSIHQGQYDLLRADPTAAAESFGRVLSYGTDCADPWYIERGLIGLAAVHRRAGRNAAAIRAARRALISATATGYRVQQEEALLELAHVHLAAGRPHIALARATAAAAIARRCGHRSGEAHAELLLGLALNAMPGATDKTGETGETGETGAQHLRHAYDLFTALGSPEAAGIAVRVEFQNGGDELVGRPVVVRIDVVDDERGGGVDDSAGAWDVDLPHAEIHGLPRRARNRDSDRG